MSRNERSLAVTMVTHRFPAAGENPTGSPAHIMKLSRTLRESGVQVSQLDVEGRDGDRETGRYACNLRTLPWRMATLLREQRPDLLHAHGHIPALAVLPIARLARIPLVCELHGVYAPSQTGATGARPLRSRVAAALERVAVRGSTHLIAQAEAMKARVMNHFGAPPGRVTVLYPGLKVAEFADYAGAAAALPGISAEHAVVMYVGSTFGFQGLDLLAQATSLAARVLTSLRVALVLSGAVESDAEVLRRFGFDPTITVIASAGDGRLIPAYCKRANVLAHTRPDCPDNINVQSKLGLYLAAGRPILATNVGDYPLLLSASAGCRLAPPEPEALAKALLEILGDTRIAAAAVSENVAMARRYFDVDANVQRLIALYRSLLRSSINP